MKKVAVVLLIISFICIFASCAAVLIGAGVAGGMELGEDSARIARDVPFNSAYSTAYKTLQEMGVITLENKYTGRIEAEVRDSKVTAQLDRITPKTVGIRITARKKITFLPNVDLSQEILNRINNKL